MTTIWRGPYNIVRWTDFVANGSSRDNVFTGTMPTTLSQLSRVTEFLFSGNNLTGSLNDGLCSGAMMFGTAKVIVYLSMM